MPVLYIRTGDQSTSHCDTVDTQRSRVRLELLRQTVIILFVVLCVKTLQVCNLLKTKNLKFTQTKILVLY